MNSSKRISIRPRGRLANRMMQLMLAMELRNRVSPDVAIIGYDLPEWGLYPAPYDRPSSGRVGIVDGHRFNLDKIAFSLRMGLIETVKIRGWGMSLEYYPSPRPYADLFQAKDVAFHELGENDILLNVRGEDILDGHHPLYFPLPLNYYEHIIRTTGLNPVFMGQLDDNVYTRLIRSRFPGARYLPSTSPMSDFQTIRNARHVALSVSSFSWLAAWLSSTAATIHMPVCGLFNPVDSTAMLLPVDDQRFHFHGLAFPTMEQRQGLDLAGWLQADHPVRALERAEVAELYRRAG